MLRGRKSAWKVRKDEVEKVVDDDVERRDEDDDVY